MSAKDAFFQKLENNANAQKEAENAQKEAEKAFKRDVLEFQKDTKALILEIKGWFEGTPVTASVGTTLVTEENTDQFEVSNITFKNGDKTLQIIPKALYPFMAKGLLAVTINNNISGSGFNLHWKDRISKLPGWVIIIPGSQGVVNGPPVQRIEFNQENFFKMITIFA